MAKGLSHLGGDGAARMVDVSAKEPTQRRAEASCRVRMSERTLGLVRGGGMRKGDVLAAARLAGIMAAKRTAELVPLCHPLPIEHVDVELAAEADGVEIRAAVRATARTGVEMEALTAAAVAALTVYDMCKAAERGIEIGPLRLEAKSGGAGGDYRRAAE